MKCASLLREAMWSMVSEMHSEIDFDYVAYTGRTSNGSSGRGKRWCDDRGR